MSHEGRGQGTDDTDRTAAGDVGDNPAEADIGSSSPEEVVMFFGQHPDSVLHNTRTGRPGAVVPSSAPCRLPRRASGGSVGKPLKLCGLEHFLRADFPHQLGGGGGVESLSEASVGHLGAGHTHTQTRPPPLTAAAGRPL